MGGQSEFKASLAQIETAYLSSVSEGTYLYEALGSISVPHTHTHHELKDRERCNVQTTILKVAINILISKWGKENSKQGGEMDPPR